MLRPVSEQSDEESFRFNAGRSSAVAPSSSSHRPLRPTVSLMSFNLAAAPPASSSSIVGVGRSSSVGTFHGRSSAAGMNSSGDFGIGSHQVRGSSASRSSHGSNPFLPSSGANDSLHYPLLRQQSSLFTAIEDHQHQQARRHSSASSAVAAAAAAFQHLSANHGRNPSPSFSSGDNGLHTLVAPTSHLVAAPDHHMAEAPPPPPQANGPSELYRLIASPQQNHNHWDAVLQRVKSHPHEACFFGPNAGGHVYALHRLLRRTTDERDEDDDFSSSSSPSMGASPCNNQRGRPGCPPVAVVKALIQACPRAMTRKQAVIDENNALSTTNSDPTIAWQVQPRYQHPQHNPPQQGQPPPPHNNHNNDDDEGDEDDGDDEDIDPQGENHPSDDVRFEYPLAIACECEHDGEVVRFLAAYLSTTLPVYRSEVFRSLDYASLSPAIVRILLEEYSGCVLERGENSEATEGDDDDCPLEQVLFWWDDPDMMGMEEDIANYPNCAMHATLFDLWEKLRMMLYAATMGTMSGYDDSKSSFQVLHCLLRIVNEGGIRGVKFPNDFSHSTLLLARFIGRENRSMFEERDEKGSLPLHIAVSGKAFLKESGGNSEYGMRVERTVEEEASEGDDQDVDNTENANQAEGEREHGGNVRPVVAFPPAQRADQDDHAEGDNSHNAGGPTNGNDQDLGNSTSILSSDMETIRLLVHQHPPSICLRDSLTGSLPIHLALEHNPHAVEVIAYLLKLYPRSVSLPDGNGRLPLHISLLKESPAWKRVLELNPMNLEVRDPVTGLLPFMLAAVSKMPLPLEKDITTDNTTKMDEVPKELNSGQQQQAQMVENDSLSTTYHLLRRNPNLAAGLGDVKQRPRSLIEQQIMVSYKPRVVKLEEENERLRQKVEELECRLLSMQMNFGCVNSTDDESGDGGESRDHGAPCLKKRKSSNTAERMR